MAERRARASRDRIEKTLNAAIGAGLTPSSIQHYPDGSFTVLFGDDGAPAKKKPRGWEDY